MKHFYFTKIVLACLRHILIKYTSLYFSHRHQCIFRILIKFRLSHQKDMSSPCRNQWFNIILGCRWHSAGDSAWKSSTKKVLFLPPAEERILSHHHLCSFPSLPPQSRKEICLECTFHSPLKYYSNINKFLTWHLDKSQ